MKTVFYNGSIYESQGITAFIVEDGIFTFCGSDTEALNQCKETDRRVDLEGRFVCAGFNDSHMHVVNYGQFLQMAHLNEHTGSLKEMLECISEFRTSHVFHEGQWLKGRGWNQDYFSDVHRMPQRNDIDRIINDIPVILTRACGHCCVVNSKALEILQIDENTPCPPGGDIGRTEGKLNGLFFDNAIELVTSRMPAPGKEEIKDMIRAACRSLNSYGITSAQSDDYSVFRQLPYTVINEAYRELEESGELTVRIYEQSNFTDIDQLKAFISAGNVTGKGTDNFRIGPLKLLGDGSLGSRTAWLSIPYADDPSTSGFGLFSDDEINELIEYAHRNNMQIAVHAIGDRCLDQILDAMETAINKYPRKDHRHGIVHCQITRPDQLERIRKLQLHVYAQSVFLDYDIKIVKARAGEWLAASSYSWKTLMNNGVTVSNGSDAPVEIPDVMKGIQCAVTRRTISGEGPYLPEQSFSVAEVLDSFTVNSARASFDENRKGMIREGYLADFTVLQEDPFKTAADRIHEIKVQSCWSGGICVFDIGQM